MPNESHDEAGGPDLNRRHLWMHLLNQAVVAQQESCGHRHLCLADLRNLPIQRLAQIVPVFRADGGFRLEAGQLFAHAKDPQRRHCVYDCSALEAYLLQRFDSGTPLIEIGEEVDELYDLPRGRGFASAKDLFLRLAARMICHPAAPYQA